MCYFIVLAAVVIFPTAAQKVSELAFGELFFGPDIGNHQYLKGRVVLIFCWSTESGGLGDMKKEQLYHRKIDGGLVETGESYIPALAKLHEQYRHRGLVVISAHYRLSSSSVSGATANSKLWNYAAKRQIPFPVYLGTSQKPPSVPHTFLFNTQGNLVFQGSALEGFKRAEELVKDSPYWLFEGRKLSSSLAPIANEIAKGYNLGKADARLQKIIEKEEGEKRADAEYMKECIQSYMDQEKSKIEHLKLTDPFYYLEAYKNFLLIFGGHPDLKEMEKEYLAVKKNRDLWESHKLFLQFQNSYYGLSPVKYGDAVDLSDPQCRKKNADKIRSLLEYGKILKAKYSATPYWEKVQPLYDEITSSMQ